MLTADSLLRMPQKGHIRFAGRKSVPVLLLQREAKRCSSRVYVTAEHQS